jgi:hypothetical protein
MAGSFKSHVFTDKLPTGEPVSFRVLPLEGCVFIWAALGGGDASPTSMTNLSFSLATRFDAESGGLPMSRRVISNNPSAGGDSSGCLDDPVPRMASKLAKVVSRVAGGPKQVFLSADLGAAGNQMGHSSLPATPDLALNHVDPFAFVESRIVKEIKDHPHLVS